MRIPRLSAFSILLMIVSSSALAGDANDAFPVSIHVDAARALGPLEPVWRFFGADEPNYACQPHGKKLIGELGELAPGQVYFRAHNLLTSGDGTPALKWGSTGAYSEDSQGNPVYNWTILDQIFGTYLHSGVKPYVEIGFMPRAMSRHPDPYQHHWSPHDAYANIFTGWAYPPQDYAKWEELVFQWARHCVQVYGKAEVESWYWETWNEPNIGYWKGTPVEFQQLHDHAIQGVRRALDTARVGGPDVAGSGGAFMRSFLEHCLRGTNYATGRMGTPLDFVSFHAKGSPVFTNGHVRMGISAQLRTIREGFGIVASYPELKNTPVIIGESDPEGCAACQGDQLGYRNGTMYSSYTAACIARDLDLADQAHVRFQGALTWAFEFENQPFFAGFRALATEGIDLPVLNVFRMLSRMKGDRVAVESDMATPLSTMLRDGVRGEPDVSALASQDHGRLFILVWHYHDDDLPGPAAEVHLELRGLRSAGGKARVVHYRIDDTHSNAYALWKRMGTPQPPSAAQQAELEKAGQLATLGESQVMPVQAGELALTFELPRQAVSLLAVDFGE